MLINLSNHPSAQWDETQQLAAARYGQLTNLPFPHIDPEGGQQYIRNLVLEYLRNIESLYEKFQLQAINSPPAEDSVGFYVHIMGELTFCFALIARLQRAGITCLASTTRRETIVNGDGLKISRFEFVRFREYISISN